MASDTLRILHLPPQLSDERRVDLFGKYGAIATKTVRRSATYTASFVKFPTKEKATEAFLQLHQLEVMGRCLSVEYAKKSLTDAGADGTTKSEEKEDVAKEATTDGKHFQAFLKKLNGWTSNDVLSQPPPPNIWYTYALPTKNTLLRIAIQLIKEPAFYTQVLHLMNKMNLPPPFEELEAEFPLLREAYDVEKYRNILGRAGGRRKDDYSSDRSDADNEESEMESDGEEIANPQANDPIKRSRPQSNKRLKIPKFVNPAKQPSTTSSSHKTMRPEDLFEAVPRDPKVRKIELKPVEKLDAESRVPETSTSAGTEVEGGFGLMFPAKKDDEGDAEGDTEKSEKQGQTDFITTEQLEENRISLNDQRLYPVFKNYHAGKPSCRLYIKNLARQVEEKDLHFIYRRYVLLSLKNPENQYDVRLMQEGRMKGQAFVTFQNVGQAQLALNDTNGYILKDKPMVVQFANPPKS